MNNAISVNGSALFDEAEDALENIAMNAKDTIERYRLINRAAVATKDIGELDRSTDHAHDMIEALENLASCVPATSAQGAMFQICIALRDVFDVERSVDDADGKLAETVRRLTRILNSLLGWIESQAGFAPDQMGYDFYLRPRSNPFHEHPKLTAYIQERQGVAAVA